MGAVGRWGGGWVMECVQILACVAEAVAETKVRCCAACSVVRVCLLWQLQLFVLLWVAQHVSHTLCDRRARRRRFRLPPSAKQQLPLKLRQQPLLRLRKNAAAQCVLVLARAMCACICSGLWCGVAARLRSCAATPVIVAQLDHLFVAAPQRGAAVVEEGHAVTRHASLNGRGERACGQRSCTSAASVLLLAP